jgi:preprotein translocase subunit SecG
VRTAPARPCATIAPIIQEDREPVNPFLAVGQILVSIALIAAILLQARGVGLSSTFGGDSAVYRSRRGVEKRLWQFTIVLGALFVIFSLVSYIVVTK